MLTCLARPLAAVILLLMVTTCAQAHPGHGLFDRGAGHAIASPYHVGVLAALGVGCWVVGRFAARNLVARRFLRYAGAAALIAAAALWTLGQ